MENHPFVSVLMTAYNREEYITESIKSILASTYTQFELIIVDDHSDDDTFAIANDFAKTDGRIKVYKNEKNLGDYPNRNIAASYAKGKYLKYLDSDDIIYPWGLEAMVYCMEKFPLAAFGLLSKNLNLNTYLPVELSGEEAYKVYFFQCALFTVGPSGSIINREAFQNAGGFSGHPYIGDTELWLKLAKTYRVICLPLNLFWWREHPHQQVHEGMRNSYYEKQTLKMHRDFLLAGDCPLDKNVAAIALRNQINILTRKSIRSFLGGHFLKGTAIIKNNQLKFTDFIMALKRNILIGINKVNEDISLH